MKKRSVMQLALQMVSGYGAEFSAWRMPGTDPAAYTNMDGYVERAKLAEQGKFQMIFMTLQVYPIIWTFRRLCSLWTPYWH
ncbi:hypothetical protein P9222_22465 [Paenibacillus amylolyticus]|nr:hypothetical protein [Paenibacillus amylolyticus]WFR61217.1 hypothetical protein P9222_22465 [Paenibacillus amylolyticus]